MSTQLNINAIANGSITAEKLGDIASKAESPNNKVTSISSSSTDAQYPSAKCVYTIADTKVDKVSGKVLSSNDYTTTEKNKLSGIAAGATAVNESTVTGWGFTKNTGTITGITMNGSSKGTSGVVNLGTVITAHQDISGKENNSNKVTSISSSSTDTQYPSAKCVWDIVGDVTNLINNL